MFLWIYFKCWNIEITFQVFTTLLDWLSTRLLSSPWKLELNAQTQNSSKLRSLSIFFVLCTHTLPPPAEPKDQLFLTIVPGCFCFGCRIVNESWPLWAPLDKPSPPDREERLSLLSVYTKLSSPQNTFIFIIQNTCIMHITHQHRQQKRSCKMLKFS